MTTPFTRRPYTTPTYVVHITGGNLEDCAIVLTLRQMRNMLNIEEFDEREDSEDETTLTFTLTQEQTAAFKERVPIEVQANVMDSEGYRVASDIGMITLSRQILREVRREQ